MQLILASQSPRRKALLALLQIPFSVCAADIDETMDPARDTADEVARVSRMKAQAVPRAPDDVVVAADTVVVCDGQVLGKPADADDAKRMLTLLSGRAHQVMTGMTVLCGDTLESVTSVTDIRFRTLSDAEIERYIAGGEPMDKAGSYAIQGGGALFASEIRGDYYNVMGLPVCRLLQVLQKVAPQILEERR